MKIWLFSHDYKNVKILTQVTLVYLHIFIYWKVKSLFNGNKDSFLWNVCFNSNWNVANEKRKFLRHDKSKS